MLSQFGMLPLCLCGNDIFSVYPILALLKSISGCAFLNFSNMSSLRCSSDVGLPACCEVKRQCSNLQGLAAHIPFVGCQTGREPCLLVIVLNARSDVRERTIIFSTIPLVSPSKSLSLEFSGASLVVSMRG